MIYILTGVAKAGKSLVSREITKRFNISNFSTDYIMMMLYRGNSELNIDPEESDPIVSKKIEPYIIGLIRTMVENNTDYLIEGVHFNPDFSRLLLDRFPNDIKIIYLGYKDIDYKDKVDELIKYKDTTDNLWHFEYKGKDFINLVKYLIEESERTYEECQKFNLEYLEISNIKDQTNEIINKLGL